MTRDQRAQPTIKTDTTMHAPDDSPPPYDHDRHLEIAQGTVDTARTLGACRTGELVVVAQQHADAVTVVIAGEFDLPAADPIRAALTLAISEPAQRLIVDLSEVTFIDATGLHVILDTYKLCRDAGRTLTIRPGPPNVHRVFELTNLLDLPFEDGD